MKLKFAVNCQVKNLTLSLLIVMMSWDANAQSKPQLLRTEYLENPLGIDAKNPRFTWRTNDGVQIAYTILVSTDSLKLSNNSVDVWDSKRVKSSDILVTYRGSKLQPYTKYFWKVKVWDKKSAQESEIASFETGLIESENWKGHWITDTQDSDLKPAAHFRREFNSSKKSNRQELISWQRVCMSYLSMERK